MWLKVWQYLDTSIHFRKASFATAKLRLRFRCLSVEVGGLFLLRVSPRVYNFRLDLPLLHEKEARELDWAVKLGILLELQGTCTYLDCSS